MSDFPFFAKNGIVANTNFVANGTQYALGANVFANTSTFMITSTASNLTINAAGLFIGNSTVFNSINSTAVGVGGVNTAATFTWSNVHTFNANVIFNGTVNAANASVLSQTLTFAATTNWVGSAGQIATLTLTGNTTINATALFVGTYILHVIQDSTGSRVPTFPNTIFKWVMGTPPAWSTAANSHDIAMFICDGTHMYGSYLPSVS